MSHVRGKKTKMQDKMFTGEKEIDCQHFEAHVERNEPPGKDCS